MEQLPHRDAGLEIFRRLRLWFGNNALNNNGPGASISSSGPPKRDRTGWNQPSSQTIWVPEYVFISSRVIEGDNAFVSCLLISQNLHYFRTGGHVVLDGSGCRRNRINARTSATASASCIARLSWLRWSAVTSHGVLITWLGGGCGRRSMSIGCVSLCRPAVGPWRDSRDRAPPISRPGGRPASTSRDSRVCPLRNIHIVSSRPVYRIMSEACDNVLHRRE